MDKSLDTCCWCDDPGDSNGGFLVSVHWLVETESTSLKGVVGPKTNKEWDEGGVDGLVLQCLSVSVGEVNFVKWKGKPVEDTQLPRLYCAREIGTATTRPGRAQAPTFVHYAPPQQPPIMQPLVQFTLTSYDW